MKCIVCKIDKEYNSKNFYMDTRGTACKSCINDIANKMAQKLVNVDQRVSPMLANVEEMQKELGILKTENEKLRFMIDNGLGWEDMINDISYPPRD